MSVHTANHKVMKTVRNCGVLIEQDVMGCAFQICRKDERLCIHFNADGSVDIAAVKMVTGAYKSYQASLGSVISRLLDAKDVT